MISYGLVCWCGQPVTSVPGLEPGGIVTGTSSWLWLCDSHRAATRRYLGEPEPNEAEPEADDDEAELIEQAQAALQAYLEWNPVIS